MAAPKKPAPKKRPVPPQFAKQGKGPGPQPFPPAKKGKGK